MSCSYEVGVVCIMLALFGGWVLVREVYDWLMRPVVQMPQAGVVLIVQNMEHQIEQVLRHFVGELERAGLEMDIIVVDLSSEDLTYAIAKRLGKEFTQVRAVQVKVQPPCAPDS